MRQVSFLRCFSVWTNSSVTCSIRPSADGKPDCDGTNTPLFLHEDRDNKVQFTYRVSWNQSTTRWATRWDHYLRISEPRIHWFALFNSIAIAVFLCVMVNLVLVRTVNRDVSRYNAIDITVRDSFA